MSTIIEEMAKVQIDEDLLREVDIDGLAKEFRESYAKLDNIKIVKQKHEERTIGKKIRDFAVLDDTLEKAQQDAQVVQGDFLKTTGRLMVINIMLSQHLEEQQKQLLIQQRELENHTKTIEGQTVEINEQQRDLAEQNEILGSLLNDYMDLKGLSRNGAEKLIEMAQKLQITRDDLLKSVECSISASQEEMRQVETNVMKVMLQVQEETNKKFRQVQFGIGMILLLSSLLMGLLFYR